jgi:hypothetical protein
MKSGWPRNQGSPNEPGDREGTKRFVEASQATERFGRPGQEPIDQDRLAREIRDLERL